MDIQHLKYVIEVAKVGSISQAAENLFLGQPTLSKYIKEVESELNTELFVRTSKGVVLTDKGEIFLKYAEDILSKYNEMKDKIFSNQTDEMTIAVPRSMYIKNAFEMIREEVNIKLKETIAMEVISLVENRKCNLGILRYQSAYEKNFLGLLYEKGLVHDTIWEFDYSALMSDKNPLANKRKVDYNELSEYVEIVHEKDSQLEFLAENPNAYMWAAPVPVDILKKFSLVQKEVYVENHKYKDVMIYPKGYELSKEDRLFIQKIQEVKKEMY